MYIVVAFFLFISMWVSCSDCSRILHASFKLRILLAPHHFLTNGLGMFADSRVGSSGCKGSYT